MSARKFSEVRLRYQRTASLTDMRPLDRLAERTESHLTRPASLLSLHGDSCNDLTRACSCEMCLWDLSFDDEVDEEKMKKLKGVVDTTRKQEEDVIEQLIECQMKIDRLTEEKAHDHGRIAELTEENARLQEEMIDALASSIMGPSSAVTDRLAKRIRDLENEVEQLRSVVSAAAESKREGRWRLLQVRKEKLEARRELSKVKEHLAEERQRVKRMRSRVAGSQEDTVDSLLNDLEATRLEASGLRARLSRMSALEVQNEHWRKRNLLLEVENRKLRKQLSEMRRWTIPHVRYNYVTTL